MLEIVGSKHQKEGHDKDLFCHLILGNSGWGHSAITVGISIALTYSSPRHRQFSWFPLGLSQTKTFTPQIREPRWGFCQLLNMCFNWAFWNRENDHRMDLLWDEARFHEPQCWLEGYRDVFVSPGIKCQLRASIQ